MPEQMAREVGPARVDLCYERFGDERLPPVLLVMGLGGQHVHWPEGLIAELAARGLHLIAFDNRDAGRSTHFAGSADFAAAMKGDFSSAAYTLSDMAADTAGLLDALGLESAHVVGASMGGQIAQLLALEHRARVRSLTSIMSTTGDPTVGRTHPEAFAAFGGPPATTREAVIERAVNAARIVGSPGFPLDEAELRARTGRAYDRDHDDAGITRQAVATMASGDRTARLHELDVPALVIHGAADIVFDPSGGRATAAAIPGAELVIIDGMGHGLPRAVWPRLADLIGGLVARAEMTRRAPA